MGLSKTECRRMNSRSKCNIMSFYIFICTFITEITQKKHTRTVHSFNKKGTKHVKFAADDTLKIRVVPESSQ